MKKMKFQWVWRPASTPDANGYYAAEGLPGTFLEVHAGTGGWWSWHANGLGGGYGKSGNARTLVAAKRAALKAVKKFAEELTKALVQLEKATE